MAGWLERWQIKKEIMAPKKKKTKKKKWWKKKKKKKKKKIALKVWFHMSEV